MDSLDNLIASNTGLVYKQLHKLNLAYNDDAYSYAMEGLFKAANTFDETRNLQFSTYASVCIYNSLMMYLRAINKNSNVTIVSYNEPINDDDDSEFAEIIPAYSSPEDDLINREHFEAVVEASKYVIASMPAGAKKRVLQLWWDSSCELNQPELAKLAKTSQATVNLALQVFRYKLKQELEDYYE